MGRPKKDIVDSIAEKLLYSEGCWEWLGAHNPKGYALVKYNGRQTFAHRTVYEVLVGPIPEGLYIDHLCRNTGCVNPDHLEPVTMRENLLRGNTHAARFGSRTHCDSGHRFSHENTIIRSDGSRRCRTCHNAKR
jgi:hypothetical protein